MASQFKTFTPGILTASEVNSYLMKQVTIVCDSSADYPASPVEGMVVHDKALQAKLVYDGTTWRRAGGYGPSAVQTYAPVVTQLSSVSASVVEAKYWRDGPIVEVWVSLNVVGTGASSNLLTVSLPVATSLSAYDTIGTGIVYDISTTTRYIANVEVLTATTVAFGVDGSGGGGFGLGGSVVQAVSTGDAIRFHVRYLTA